MSQHSPRCRQGWSCHRMVPLLLACASTARGDDAPPGGKPPSATITAFAAAEYRWFHAHPELAFQEHATAARMAAALEAMGCSVRRGVGGTGVVAVLKGERPGPEHTVLYRADMDALPITEQTRLPYASQNAGVMHACGHDLHLAIALGALRTMAEQRHEWSGTLVFVAQPAEETGAGALRVLADPAFRQILAQTGKPRVALAVHDLPDVAAGKIAVSSGYTTANVDSVDLTLFGKEGHGATPEQTVDSIVLAAEVVLQLQTIVSRRIAPEAAAVISVGSFRAGSTHNIIPSSAELLLTVRSYDGATRRTLLAEIEHVARSVAISYHAPPPRLVVRESSVPAGFNDAAWSARLRERFHALFGEGRVVPIPPTMSGDDFARFNVELGIPSVYFRLGAGPVTASSQRAQALPRLHSATWAPDVQTALPLGIQAVVAALHEGLASP